jgi:hypothetical protein
MAEVTIEPDGIPLENRFLRVLFSVNARFLLPHLNEHRFRQRCGQRPTVPIDRR